MRILKKKELFLQKKTNKDIFFNIKSKFDERLNFQNLWFVYFFFCL